jgi:hypothetical protein
MICWSPQQAPNWLKIFLLALNHSKSKISALSAKSLACTLNSKQDGFTLDQETLVRKYVEAHSSANANSLTTLTTLHQDPGGEEPLNAFQIKQFRSLPVAYFGERDAHAPTSPLPCTN